MVGVQRVIWWGVEGYMVGCRGLYGGGCRGMEIKTPVRKNPYWASKQDNWTANRYNRLTIIQ